MVYHSCSQFITHVSLSPYNTLHAGQFWNIPILVSSVNGESYIEIYDPSHDKYRRFPAEFYVLVWDRSYGNCYYAGNSQGGPERGHNPVESVIEGVYTQYTTDGLFETDFQYKQFDDDRCSS